MSLQNKQSTMFWKEIKKLNKTSVVTTDIMDGEIGEDNIRNIFKNKYESLYNEFRENESDVEIKLNHLIDNNCRNKKCNTNHEISKSDVIKATENLKSNKYDFIFDISSNNI